MKNEKEETLEVLKAKISELEAQVESLETQATAQNDQLLRTLADCKNIKRRSAEEISRVKGLANAELIGRLLPVIDNLERASDHQNDEGLSNIIKQLHLVLAGEGVSTIESDGEEFDPHTMECVDIAPGPKNIVVRTASKGYLYGENVLRPAHVEVGNGLPTEIPSTPSGSSSNSSPVIPSGVEESLK